MARPSPDPRNAGDATDEDLGELDILDDDAEDEPQPGRARATEALWAELRVDPVEIALPTGSGYTLRAYRPAEELTPTEVAGVEDDDPFDRAAARPLDEDDDTGIFEEAPGGRSGRRRRDDADDEDEAVDDELDEDRDDDELDTDTEDDEDQDDVDEEEVPVFLGHRGRLFLFRTPESLVEFIRSGAEHDLTQLDSWPDLVARIQPEDVAAGDDDTYELDLVVENLRAGHDAWDPGLLISAGEIARDLAYAYRMDAVLTALSPGTPLDDLDEAARGTVEGGLTGFLAKRRLRKIGAQQATLGWRTIIGKISGVVVWRD